MKVRISSGVFVFLAVIFLAWYGGLDMGERGVMQAYSVFAATVFAVLAATFPLMGD